MIILSTKNKILDENPEVQAWLEATVKILMDKIDMDKVYNDITTTGRATITLKTLE